MADLDKTEIITGSYILALQLTDLYDALTRDKSFDNAPIMGINEIIEKTDGNPDDDFYVHNFVKNYGSSIPKVIIINECDWGLYIKTITLTTVTIGYGSAGSAEVIKYKLLVIK